MGYKSAATIALKSEDGSFEREYAKLLLLNPPWMEVIKDNASYITYTPGKNMWVFAVNSWKWYPDYPFEAFWEYFQDLSEATHNIDGAFIIVGEGSDDVTQSFIREGMELAYVSTEIIHNF